MHEEISLVTLIKKAEILINQGNHITEEVGKNNDITYKIGKMSCERIIDSESKELFTLIIMNHTMWVDYKLIRGFYYWLESHFQNPEKMAEIYLKEKIR